LRSAKEVRRPDNQDALEIGQEMKAKPARPHIAKIALVSAMVLGMVLLAMLLLRWIHGAGSCWACGL